MLAAGPAIATMILSRGRAGGRSDPFSSVFPSIASIGASCGMATNPPAGMLPRRYSTPPMVFDQSGLPNQIANFSTFNPRHLAAKK